MKRESNMFLDDMYSYDRCDKMREKIDAALNKIRPVLQADGGDVELVDVTKDGVVKVRLVGACAGCPMSAMTLAFGIERELKKQVPGVKHVEPV
jgi:Fe-S cluster biogenesis protein NfuA